MPAVIVADIATKNIKHFEEADHYKQMHWWIFLCFIPLAYTAKKYPKYRFWASLMFTGGLLNYFDSLNGHVVNPFILIVQETGIGFNIADIAILGGFIGSVVIYVKSKKIGRVKWKNV